MMNNPLFNMMGNPIMNMMQRFQQFRQTFQGNPQEQIQQMISSGKINKQQYRQAVQMAQQLKQMIGGK